MRNTFLPSMRQTRRALQCELPVLRERRSIIVTKDHAKKDTKQRPPPRSSMGEESCKEREGEKESISSSVESIRMGGKSKDSVRRKREEIYLQKA